MGTSPHDERVWSERELWDRDRLAEYQLGALTEQLRSVYANSDYYRQRFGELGWEPGDLTSLEDLRKLPFTTKADYVATLDDGPWSSALAVPRSEVRRVHFSSGTTAAPAPMYWTQQDLDRWADLYARAVYSQGIREGDVYQCLFNYSWFVGGLGATAGYQRVGCACIPGGSGDTRRQIDTIGRFGVSVVGGTPSFLLHIAEVAAEAGISLAESSVRYVMTGGEPGAALPGVRAQIERAWGAKAFDGYGSIEFQPIAWECAAQSGGHLAEDFALAEVLDPETLEPVPDGTAGVLVLTHLDKRAAPLVRWWTGDVVVRDSARCECGRTMARLPGGVQGRADGMLVVRGVNVFPSAVEDVIRSTLQTVSEFRLVLDPALEDPATGQMTGIRVDVELPADREDELDTLAAAIRRELMVRAVLNRLEPGSLPRTTLKAARVVTPDS